MMIILYSKSLRRTYNKSSVLAYLKHVLSMLFVYNKNIFINDNYKVTFTKIFLIMSIRNL